MEVNSRAVGIGGVVVAECLGRLEAHVDVFLGDRPQTHVVLFNNVIYLGLL